MAGNQDFVATISAFAAKTPQRIEAVFRDATQSIVSVMQTPVGDGGNMPVDTGFMRATVQASNEDMPSINPDARPPDDAEPNSIPYAPSTIQLVIAQTRIDQTIFVGYTAAYAGIQEERRGFVRLAAIQWPAIVAESAQKLEAGLIGGNAAR